MLNAEAATTGAVKKHRRVQRNVNVLATGRAADRRLALPWTVEETNACFIVRDHHWTSWA
jgi:hypothetical protein